MKTLQEIAEKHDLEIIETTSERNGYPRDLKLAITGFDTFEDAENLAKKYGLNIESFTSRDGWGVWYRTGGKMYKPFELDVYGDFGDNYSEESEKDVCENLSERLEEDIFENIDEKIEFIKEQLELLEEISRASDDGVVVSHYGEYWDTFPRESMRFSHDTRQYIIGLIER